MKYFVTGATGFIGKHVALQLAQQGHEVNALARNLKTANGMADQNIKLWEGDILDKESMRKPMMRADGVFHIAGWYKVGVKDKSMAHDINVQGTRNVLELMRELGIPKGVYTSTLAVFSDTKGQQVNENYRHNGPWLSEYDRTKWLAHYEVALPMILDGLPLVIVQPGVNYGPGDTSSVGKLLRQYLRREVMAIPYDTAYCWAHVDDTARGHIQAMEKGRSGEAYIIAGPVHTVIEAMEIAEKITGIPAPKRRLKPRFLKTMATLMALLEKIYPVPETYSSEYLRTVAGVTYLGNSDKARKELDFSPRPLEEGLRETLLHETKVLELSREVIN